MTPDELSRELQDLDRLAPPSIDPTRLLQLETRISDLEQENTELRQNLAQHEAKIAELLLAMEQRNGELLALRTAQQKREKEWEAGLTDWRQKQQNWSALALRERADLRSKRTQWIQSAGVAVAGIAICFGFWMAGEKYWTFTHNDELRMMETAARDKADALAAYQNANKDLAEIARLRSQIRRRKAAGVAVDSTVEKPQ